MIDEDIVAVLRGCAADSRATEGDYYADQFATAPEIFEKAAAEIERLRSQPCPYVTGKTTQYCTLTPFALTDAEREAVRYMIAAGKFGQRDAALTEEHAATLRGLLERTK